MVRRQPALLSVSVSGNVLEVAEFFSKEMGLGTDQVSKIFCCHPQVKMRFSCRRRFFCVEVSREAQNRCEANGTSQARGRKQPYMPQGSILLSGQTRTLRSISLTHLLSLASRTSKKGKVCTQRKSAEKNVSVVGRPCAGRPIDILGTL